MPPYSVQAEEEMIQGLSIGPVIGPVISHTSYITLEFSNRIYHLVGGYRCQLAQGVEWVLPTHNLNFCLIGSNKAKTPSLYSTCRRKLEVRVRPHALNGEAEE